VRPAGFAIPGDLGAPTGGYAYARGVLAAAPGAFAVIALPGDFPAPSKASAEAAAKAMAAWPADLPLLVDGLAFGAMPTAALRRVKAPMTALLHHPLGLETGLSGAEAARLTESERAALGFAKAVVVTSAATAQTVAAMFGVDPARITVARPGLERAPRATGGGATPVILCVATLTPRKGQDVLVEALARLRGRPWRAVLTGALDRAPDYAQAVARQIAGAGLGDRVRLTGPADAAALAAHYAGADLFCLPSRYEGYGMVFAEAMARGLPVVAARIAAAEEVVGEDAGTLVPADDPDALAGALAALLDDPGLRRAKSEAALARAAALPGWDETAATILRVMEGTMPMQETGR
jgi:glycosyltransferase involved in cell wall biosynthesis